MSTHQGTDFNSSRRNRLLGWGLGILSVLLYLGITFRWTRVL
jgi:hypothetical protein